jgi:O-succinylhomoserine sulfhydrylase
MKNDLKDPNNWSAATKLVHAGTMRSQFAENSEALFLTQGHVYASAEEAEARFKGAPGFIYARFSNPTVAMFEQRLAALEGAEACRATATGMAAVTATMMGLVSAGDHIVAAKALFGSCRYVIETLLPRFGCSFTLVDGNDLKQWEKAARPNTKVFFFGKPNQPNPRRL